MLVEGLRRLTLGGLNEDGLEELIAHGEDLFVEKKRQPPEPPRFGASIGAFANTLGGFVLLGIDDAGDVCGWEPPGGADVQSHLAALLRQELDPLPPFVAEKRALRGTPIVVIRVFESVDTPHVVRGTGAIYVRSASGKEPVPVDDHLTLRQMAQRGARARKMAEERLASTPEVVRTFELADRYLRRWKGAQFLAKAAPHTVPPQLTEWPLTRRAAEACERAAGRLIPQTEQPGILGHRLGPKLRPFGRGIEATVIWERGDTADEAVALVDSAGVSAVALRPGLTRGRCLTLIQAILEEQLRPLARELADLLKAAEVVGPCAVDLTYRASAAKAMIGGGEIPDSSDPRHTASTLISPADKTEVEELALRWHRELQREFGIVKFEDAG